MKSFYFVTVLFVSFILFTACGEECKGSDCGESVDEISVVDDENVDNEILDSDILVEDTETNDDVVDEATDETTDEVVDEENPDEDQVVTNFCEKMLDIAGDWYKIEGGDKITMTLVSMEDTCKVTMTWQQGWKTVWYGLELPLEKVYDSETERYYALKKSGENLVRESILKNGDLNQEIVFIRNL